MSTTFIGMPTVPGTGNLFERAPFPQVAQHELGNVQLRTNLTKATTAIRTKRAARVAELGDWEDLRDSGAAAKDVVLARLPELLTQFEAAFTAAGGTVHWARDAQEANAIVRGLVEDSAPLNEDGRREVIKVKSMATQEIGLNEYLEDHDIDAYETDLAELIVQLGHDKPSHILVPAIHRNRHEIRQIFLRGMEDADPNLGTEPRELAEASRKHLRKKFLTTKVAISGANFGIAETGTLSVVESEGNGRMCVTLPETLITVMGIEKLLPTIDDLGVFMQLLPRSSTGERMNPYSSFWTGVTPGDGPRNVHVVLLDNGRTRALADQHGRQALRCIRCSACMNVCPVYERTGGHAYGSVYPGPIGAILTPLLTGTDAEENSTLPYASSLCGACFDACPVKIDIPQMLVRLRNEGNVVKESEHGRLPKTQLDVALTGASWLMSDGRRMALMEKGLPLAKLLSPKAGIRSLPGIAGAWTSSRTIPRPPRQSFRSWWSAEHREEAREERREARDRAQFRRFEARSGAEPAPEAGPAPRSENQHETKES
ncbi:(4Fe-4S)-binding protein [Brevibacterium sp. 5221]|uniref:(4Fe-4S)-binding protein n=1 Tax=Brevibacterium rongguiense TaxID=2695267 RepID=A0A6N9H6W4_9MICO|nr:MULTISPECIES: lactate utilization protein B [Brevibacterium]MYM19693.1 (4Fe-4S)-binding protein [Brevibacterium rongguiense]WAL39939.1 lactate utilization protein B [Brevibacterium sp. BRM-1]